MFKQSSLMGPPQHVQAQGLCWLAEVCSLCSISAQSSRALVSRPACPPTDHLTPFFMFVFSAVTHGQKGLPTPRKRLSVSLLKALTNVMGPGRLRKTNHDHNTESHLDTIP